MRLQMRSAMAMIEMIFAIVIIAMSVMTIPVMISVAGESSKAQMVDDDVMARLRGWAIDKFQARWDRNYAASESGPLLIVGDIDLPCNRGVGAVLFRANPDSAVVCDPAGRAPSVIPANGSGVLANGIEELNWGNGAIGELITITPSVGAAYTVTATYRVDYVTAALNAIAGDTATATWRLGSSQNMNPAPSAVVTHLKRVVIRFNDPNLQVDGVLTFFKSNKGN